jgi:hypothetical protein
MGSSASMGGWGRPRAGAEATGDQALLTDIDLQRRDDAPRSTRQHGKGIALCSHQEQSPVRSTVSPSRSILARRRWRHLAGTRGSFLWRWSGRRVRLTRGDLLRRAGIGYVARWTPLTSPRTGCQCAAGQLRVSAFNHCADNHRANTFRGTALNKAPPPPVS